MVIGTEDNRRGPLIPHSNRPRLVIIGDSILEKSTRELKAALQNAGSNLEVVNLSVGGSALTYDAPKNWNKAAPLIAASLQKGDKVVINLSHNDFYAMGKRRGWDNSFLDNNTYMTKADYLNRYETMVKAFKDQGAEVFVAGPAPYLKPDPGASPFVERHYPAAVQRIPVLSKELQALSKRMGVHFIPTLENAALQQKDSRIPDGLHLSDSGRMAFATQIASSVTHPVADNKLVASASTIPAASTTQGWRVSKPPVA